MANVKVRVIRQRGQAALVEWVDSEGAHRATIPAGAIHKGHVAKDELEYGIPYGVPWEELIALIATPTTIAAELRRRGIWTKGDLFSQPNVAVSAIQASYGFDLAALIKAARQHE